MNEDLVMWNEKFYSKDYTAKVPGLTLKRAKEIGDEIGVDWDLVDLGEWIQGVKEETEHTGVLGGDVTAVIEKGDLVASGRIAYEHILEVPDYYSRLEKMEHEGEDDHPYENAAKDWVKQNREKNQALWDSVA